MNSISIFENSNQPSFHQFVIHPATRTESVIQLKTLTVGGIRNPRIQEVLPFTNDGERKNFTGSRGAHHQRNCRFSDVQVGDIVLGITGCQNHVPVPEKYERNTGFQHFLISETAKLCILNKPESAI